MSNAELSTRIHALREKRKAIGQFIYAKAMSIELAVDKLKDAKTEEGRYNLMRDIQEEAESIRAFLDENP